MKDYNQYNELNSSVKTKSLSGLNSGCLKYMKPKTQSNRIKVEGDTYTQKKIVIATLQLKRVCGVASGIKGGHCIIIKVFLCEKVSSGQMSALQSIHILYLQVTRKMYLQKGTTLSKPWGNLTDWLKMHFQARGTGSSSTTFFQQKDLSRGPASLYAPQRLARSLIHALISTISPSRVPPLITQMSRALQAPR